MPTNLNANDANWLSTAIGDPSVADRVIGFIDGSTGAMTVATARTFSAAVTHTAAVTDTAAHYHGGAVTNAATVIGTGPHTLGGALTIGTTTSNALGFFGNAGVSQRSGAAQAAVTTTAATTSTPWGFAQNQANSIVALVNELRATMVAHGMIAGS
jgi:hypothetical protein